MLGFGVVLCLMVILTVVGIAQVNRMNGALSAINDVYSVKQRYAIIFRGSVHDRSVAVRDVVLASPQEQGALVADIQGDGVGRRGHGVFQESGPRRGLR